MKYQLLIWTPRPKSQPSAKNQMTSTHLPWPLAQKDATTKSNFCLAICINMNSQPARITLNKNGGAADQTFQQIVLLYKQQNKKIFLKQPNNINLNCILTLNTSKAALKRGSHKWPTFKAPIKQAVNSVIHFKETHTFRDDLSRTFLVFSKLTQEFRCRIHLLKIKTKRNQNTVNFDKETIAFVKITSEPTLYIDCTNTSVKTAQDLSGTRRIQKVKTDKEKNVFQVEAYYQAQTFALINMDLEQRLPDKFGKSIVITDNLQNLFTSGKNFIVLNKTGKEKPVFTNSKLRLAH
ncbi:hypothetical protein ROZALSC1DRAFT_23177 [Rozella allomycis CSF55]|uniref:Uncharacterized protein n=1 Tax=Rozella allomycis (strain CSF55) TaxID=988480 RepID=A0A4V1IZL7_ROZAC|nr:hypothetical protein ROZALSC1DRAFT_23177 [Rozella allomycis CSF55]